MYKVRWKGYGPEEDTWEPIDNLESCLDVVEEYNQRQSELARKRAEERRKRKVFPMMLLSPVSPRPLECHLLLQAAVMH